MSNLKLLSDLKSEFKKVSWLSKPDLMQQSKVVLISILLVGCLVYAADLGIQSILSLIAGVLKWIMG